MIFATRIALPLAVLASICVFALYLHGQAGPSRALGFALLTGAVLGIVLQRARFCFLCNLRDFIDNRDPRGVLSIITALAAGTLGYAIVFGAFLPEPLPGRLPPDAHIGPVSFALAAGALAFGLGMAIAGSCISAHLYRLGEGHPTSIFALTGTVIGFGLGFLTWNTLFLSDLANGPVLWLPHHLGYAGTLAVTFLVLAFATALVLVRARPAPNSPEALTPRTALQALFVARWPPVLAGLLIAAIGTFAYFRFAPLGVTSQLGTLARTGAGELGLLPDTLYGLDTFRGCATALGDALLTENGHLVLGLVLGSFPAALAAGRFQPSWPSIAQIRDGLFGGVLMGWGAMTALGCTVGVLLSGIQAGAVAGWVFLAFCTAGAALGLRLTRRRA
jgi:uncharacterized membrane protein YedE/YeeE